MTLLSKPWGFKENDKIKKFVENLPDPDKIQLLMKLVTLNTEDNICSRICQNIAIIHSVDITSISTSEDEIGGVLCGGLGGYNDDSADY